MFCYRLHPHFSCNVGMREKLRGFKVIEHAVAFDPKSIRGGFGTRIQKHNVSICFLQRKRYKCVDTLLVDVLTVGIIAIR